MTLDRPLIKVVGTLFLANTFSFQAAWADTPEQTVRDTVFDIQERFLDQFTVEELSSMDTSQVLENITVKERVTLGTEFVSFNVNVPVVVSVIREPHATDLFWLKDLGFTRTGLTARVRYESDWEVWQARFEPGKVGLGVNELEVSGSNESYVVAVEAADEANRGALEISELYHPFYALGILEEGVPAWADESSRYFEAVPEALRGQTLVQLLRIRRNDGQLVGYNKLTEWPSSPDPDQVILTLGDTPASSVTVQWRTSLEESSGQVAYQEKHLFTGFSAGDDFLMSSSNGPLLIDSPRHKILADYDSLDDYPGGLLDLRPEPGNDREVNRHIVPLSGLKPGTTYVYAVGNGQAGEWTEPREFTTDEAGEESDDAFSFLYMGDVQVGHAQWQQLADQAHDMRPDARFVIMAGDMVDLGQQRHDWDAFFHAGEKLYGEISIVPVVGNHERNGLSPKLFLDHFDLPENGPEGMEEQVYSFEYGNAFFAVVDGNKKGEAELQQQVDWLDTQLAQTNARWKFVSIHQPVYGSRASQDEPVLREAFVPVFDRHGVDLMLQGHTHGYLRTQSMKNGVVVPDGEGTVYLVANAGEKHYTIGGFREKYGVDPAVMIGNLSSYQVIDIDGNTLEYRAYDRTGTVVDELVLEKADTETPIPGDADGNGFVDRDDVYALRGHLRQDASECPACDMDGDGVISMADARLLALELR